LLIGIPVLAIAITFIIFDRHFNSVFYFITYGGDILFYQHLFWFFGHPEVYILILPGFGLVSESILRNCNKCLFGHDSIIISLMLITLLGCIV
jgi:heme/copper-type cytochrome/quinol oxidase subunit 1